MFGFFKRWRLIDQGRDCGKRRRTIEESEFFEALERGWTMRAIILAAFVLGLAALIFTGIHQEPA